MSKKARSEYSRYMEYVKGVGWHVVSTVGAADISRIRNERRRAGDQEGVDFRFVNEADC